jgi:transitional endoplasmic reticulum ATPase
VSTSVSYAGPERSLDMIFSLARQSAPCILVFEDLDSIVTPLTRSYFFNQVDGLSDNDGILMVGSTNHLDQLDDG